MKSVSQCKTQVSALIQRTWNEFLMLSILPNPTAWEWGYQSVVPLLNVTADGSGPYRTTVPAQPFDLLSVGELVYRFNLNSEVWIPSCSCSCSSSSSSSISRRFLQRREPDCRAIILSS